MSLLDHSPQFSIEAAAAMVKRHYGLSATAEVLPSERDQNFLLTAGSGKKFVLKIANALESRALLDAQQAVLAQVAPHTNLCQQVVAALDGSTITELESVTGQRHFGWLVTYLEGRPLGHIQRRTPALLQDLGR